MAKDVCSETALMLDELVDEFGIKPTQIASVLGVSPQTVYERKRDGQITLPQAMKLVAFLWPTNRAAAMHLLTCMVERGTGSHAMVVDLEGIVEGVAVTDGNDMKANVAETMQQLLAANAQASDMLTEIFEKLSDGHVCSDDRRYIHETTYQQIATQLKIDKLSERMFRFGLTVKGQPMQRRKARPLTTISNDAPQRGKRLPAPGSGALHLAGEARD